jgi:hypothetical protein
MPSPTIDPGAGGDTPRGLGDFLAAALASVLQGLPANAGIPPAPRPLARPGQGREAIEAPPRDEWSAPPPNPAYPWAAVPVPTLPNIPYDPSTGTYRPTWGNTRPPDFALPPGVGRDDSLPGWTPAPLPLSPVYGGHLPGPPPPPPPLGSRDLRAWAQWEADMRRYRAQHDVY